MAIGPVFGATGALRGSPGAERSPETAARVKRALEAGAACLSRDHDGSGFRDPYLTFVYPGEALPTPLGSPPLTYRRIDADFILALLARSSPPGGASRHPVQEMSEAARRTLERAAPLWQSRGLSNVRRQPSPRGIALDTYCMVGWLAQDRVMADNVARAIDGDGWLPQNLYAEEERFRADADECWCLKFLASPAGPGLAGATPVLDRIARSFRRAAQNDPGSRATFYEAFHLGMVLEEADRASRLPGRRIGGISDRRMRDISNRRASGISNRRPSALAGDEDVSDAEELKRETRDALRIWADRQESAASALVEWANLAACEILDDEPGTQLRRRALEVLLEAQEKDGCWRLREATPASYGSSFLTLRALLGLAVSPSGGESEASRVGSSSAAPRAGASSGPPAPKAARPAQ
jgi:hypothetical protein